MVSGSGVWRLALGTYNRLDILARDMEIGIMLVGLGLTDFCLGLEYMYRLRVPKKRCNTIST